MSGVFQPPPTFALPVIVDEKTGKEQFSPIWLNWFLKFAQWLNGAGGTAFDPALTIITNQVFSPRDIVSKAEIRRLRADANIILSNQVFGD